MDDKNIIKGIQLLHQHSGLIVEPSAAVGIAAIMEHKEVFKDKTVGSIICGGNISEEQFQEWF